jgi:hypothetical protein
MAITQPFHMAGCRDGRGLIARECVPCCPPPLTSVSVGVVGTRARVDSAEAEKKFGRRCHVIEHVGVR